MSTLVPKYQTSSYSGSVLTNSVNRAINLKLQEQISVLDFGADPTGTNDSSTAINNALSSLSFQGKLFFPAGIYKITSSINLSSSAAVARPIEIYGCGIASQIINNCSTGNATFVANGVEGFYIHDLAITGATAYPNDGIHIDGSTSSGASFNWQLRNLTLMMPGYGIKVTNGLVGLIEECQAWPIFINGSPLPSPVTVSASLINHYIYLTGSYNNIITIKNCYLNPNVGYTGYAIVSDSTTSNGCGIYDTDVEWDANTATGHPAIILNQWNNFVLQNLYNEGTQITLNNCYNGVINSITDGGAYGQVYFENNCVHNTISAVYQSSLVFTNGCLYNTVLGANIRTSYYDDSNPSNIFLNSSLVSTSPIVPYGLNSIYSVTNSSQTFTPDCSQGTTQLIKPGSGAYTIASPTKYVNGQVVTFTIRNASGSSITATWNSIYKMSSWTDPANGYSRSITFQYDASYSVFRQISQQNGVDIPN